MQALWHADPDSRCDAATCRNGITLGSLSGALSAGAVVINSTDGSTITVGVNGGFLQVFHNQVTLLTDRAEITEGGKEDALRLAQEMGTDEAV